MRTERTAAPVVALLGLLAGLVLCAGSGCAVKGVGPANTASWAQQVARMRAHADKAVAAEDLATAEAVLRRIFVLPAPTDNARALQLLQDAHFALGSVLYLNGDHDGAAAEADQGLALTDEPSVFSANLHALRAMSLEAGGRELDALDDYEKALVIHKQLFNEMLDGKGGVQG